MSTSNNQHSHTDPLNGAKPKKFNLFSLDLWKKRRRLKEKEKAIKNFKKIKSQALSDHFEL